MYCKNCGNEIDNQTVVCPKCGVAVYGKLQGEKKFNTLAIVGFVLAFLVSVAGLICSIIARKQCNERGEDGSGFALAGIIISITGMCLTVIYIIMVFITLFAITGLSATAFTALNMVSM